MVVWLLLKFLHTDVCSEILNFWQGGGGGLHCTQFSSFLSCCPDIISASVNLCLTFNAYFETWMHVICCFISPNVFMKTQQLIRSFLEVRDQWEAFSTNDQRKASKNNPRWWFQIFCYFHPYLGKWSNLTNIFRNGGSTTNQLFFSSPSLPFGFKRVTLPKFNISPLKSYYFPIGKDRLPTTIFQLLC